MASQDMLAQIVRALVGVDTKHHGVLLDVVNKLNGTKADAHRRRFAEVLRAPLPLPYLRPFCTIKLGTDAHNGSLRSKIRQKPGFELGPLVDEVCSFDGVPVAPEEIEVDLVAVSVEDLGFEARATHEEICAKAQEAGLHLCPAEVGLQLRLQFVDDGKELRWLYIGMEKINYYIFTVFRDTSHGMLHLSTDADSHGPRGFSGDARFVFILPRK